jgi:sRNA-binding protein
MKKKKNIPFEQRQEMRQRVLDDWLVKDYPQVFNLNNPVPLAIGISHVLEENMLPENVSRADLKFIMGWYCSRTSYLRSMIGCKHRINLQGEIDCEITAEEKIVAYNRLDSSGKQIKLATPTTAYVPKATVEVSQESTPKIESAPNIVSTTDELPKRPILKRKIIVSNVNDTPPILTEDCATAKTLKVTLVIDPSCIPRTDSNGLKTMPLRVNIDNTSMSVTANVSAKSYRKALSSIDEHGVDNCNVIVQGAMKQYGVIDDAGLVVQPKKS